MGGVEVQFSLWPAVGLRFAPLDSLHRSLDVVGTLRRPAVERLGRPERHRLRLATGLLHRLLRAVVLATRGASVHRSGVRLPDRLLAHLSTRNRMLNVALPVQSPQILAQFLRWQVDKIDLERVFEMLNAILQFDCRFCIWQVSWSVEK